MSSANAFNLIKSKIFCRFEKSQLVLMCIERSWFNFYVENVNKTVTLLQTKKITLLKAFADDNFRFDENSRKFSKWVENTVGRGEIARNEQFLLFPQCFNPFPNKPWFLRVCKTSLLKTSLFITSNFSFSHSVFYPFKELSAIFIEFEIVVCKLFQFGRV